MLQQYWITLLDLIMVLDIVDTHLLFNNSNIAELHGNNTSILDTRG